MPLRACRLLWYCLEPPSRLQMWCGGCVGAARVCPAACACACACARASSARGGPAAAVGRARMAAVTSSGDGVAGRCRGPARRPATVQRPSRPANTVAHHRHTAVCVPRCRANARGVRRDCVRNRERVVGVGGSRPALVPIDGTARDPESHDAVAAAAPSLRHRATVAHGRAATGAPVRCCV